MKKGFTSVPPSNILIKGAEIINANGRKKADILIENGVIKEVSVGIRRKIDVEINGSGLIALPGAIDIHFHIREPGAPYEEDIESGTLSAAHGGITSLFMMPNTKPPLDSPELISFIRQKAEKKALSRVFPVGAATEKREGKKISEYGLMLREGIIAVTDDGSSISSSFAMRKSLEYAKTFGLTVIEHAEDKELSGDANEGYLTQNYGITPYPNAAEDVIVARDIILAELTGGNLHLTHVSSGNSIEMIREAKRKIKNARITCDVTPHHLIFCDEDIQITNTNLKVNPPIRSKRDRQKLIEAILDNTVDAIASDHAPHPRFLKENDFVSAPPGISSADFFVPILYSELVQKGLINIEKLVELISFNPAMLFGIPAGQIAEGKIGDIVLLDPDKEYNITKDMLYSKGKNSPYINFKIKGKVIYTIINGKVCYQADLT
ncbi:MAG: dihydroorotase [Candidatus Calescibacterium sp.]|nr:dihydroorotase [Candidatus Calescibacterium sp.]MCX7734718.1 dihydroorotase [bacterium]MDW8087300.1 dihydroorotase [Candidatus Calescibacterium sp.]